MFKRLFSGSRMTRECPVRFCEKLSGLARGFTHHKRFIIITLILCGINQQMYPLYVTHFSQESIAARSACVIEEATKNPITEEQIDTCITALQQYVDSMRNRINNLMNQYKWIMNHSEKLTNEQVGRLKISNHILKALETYKMITSWLADASSTTEQFVNLMSYDSRSTANILASGETELSDFEKLINHYVSLAQQNNENTK